MEWADQVDHQNPLPILVAYVVKVRRGNEAGGGGVVHQQVEPAEGFHRFRDHQSHRRVVGNIGLDGQCPATQGLDVGHGLHGLVVRTRVVHQHGAVELRQTHAVARPTPVPPPVTIAALGMTCMGRNRGAGRLGLWGDGGLRGDLMRLAVRTGHTFDRRDPAGESGPGVLS